MCIRIVRRVNTGGETLVRDYLLTTLKFLQHEFLYPHGVRLRRCETNAMLQ